MFNIRSLAQHVNILASFLPNGKTFVAKNIDLSNLRKLLTGLAGTTKEIDEAVNTIINEYDIKTTTNEDSILLWEKAVGIPDACFNTNETLETRAKQVVAKLIAKGVQTDTDFNAIFDAFGLNVQIYPNTYFGLPFPPYDVAFFPSSGSRSRFVLVVKGDNIEPDYPEYSVPFFPAGTNNNLVSCIISKLKPAHVKVIYLNN